jgi:hypothetical protein
MVIFASQSQCMSLKEESSRPDPVAGGWLAPGLRQIQAALEQMHPLLLRDGTPVVRRYGKSGWTKRLTFK